MLTLAQVAGQSFGTPDPIMYVDDRTDPPVVKVVLSVHSALVDVVNRHPKTGHLFTSPRMALKPEVREYLREREIMPDPKEGTNRLDRPILIRFTDPNEALAFKLRWL